MIVPIYNWAFFKTEKNDRKVNFCPYNSIPERYKRADNKINIKQVAKSIPADNATCQYATPNGKRAIIAIGEVNGIIESHTANDPLGFEMINGSRIIGKNNGSVTGIINCCVSVSWSDIAPMPAKSAAYNK